MRWILLLALLPGRATYTRSFINANGDVATCQMTGQGLIGMSTASTAVNGCAENFLSLGYLEMTEAGYVPSAVPYWRFKR